MTTNLHRPVCDLLGCTYPLVLAGMGGVARSELAAAVAEAGGFGFLGMVREPVALIRSEVQAMRARGVQRFGVNLIPAATPAELLDAQLEACIELKVPVVALFWDLSSEAVRRLRAAGIVVVCQVGAVDEARAARQAGAQVIIAQGCEAGGHVRGSTSLEELLPQVVAAADCPVLAAGGITDGRDVATALAFGAQGAVLGTALMATHESFAHSYHKERLVAASGSDTVLTDIFHINWPRGAKVRVLSNSVTQGGHGDPFRSERTVIGDEDGRPIYLFSTDSPMRSMTGEFEAMALYSGMGVGRIGAIVSAGERLRAIAAEASAILAAESGSMSEIAESASSVCYAETADDSYMGFASREELLEALNELLEAERAGSRVCLRTAQEMEDATLETLVEDIQRDEAHWCAVLTKAILALGASPSTRIGAFHEKAMAIPALPERLAFLNRGQGWVVKRLRQLLPKVRDDALHRALSSMLASHERNIDRVNTNLQTSR
jgi:nitronate monooxygenase